MDASTQSLVKAVLKFDKTRSSHDLIKMRALAEKILEEEHSCCCDDPDQCWEPCGSLGKDEEYVKVSDTQILFKVPDRLFHTPISALVYKKHEHEPQFTFPNWVQAWIDNYQLNKNKRD